MNEDIPERQRIKAKDNPWYLLATLYGQPTSYDDDLVSRNRTAWNRYVAETLTNEQRASLIEKGFQNTEELTPFSLEELSVIEEAFVERHRQAGSTVSIGLPTLEKIDFSYVTFDHHFFARDFFFPNRIVNFEGTTFSGIAIFDGATFSSGAFFQNANFFGTASFEGAVFSHSAIFRRVAFYRVVNFKKAIFSHDAFLQETVFSYDVVLQSATFFGDAFFQNATFSRGAFFQGATFSREAVFENTTFSGRALFEGTAFCRKGLFKGAVFSGDADFRDVKFSGDTVFKGATFSSEASFVNVEMKGPTSFEVATFSSSPPTFFGAKLHEGTVWRGVEWPRLPKTAGEAGQFVDAYERLKLEMDRLKKHEDELHFFALELQSRQILKGPIAGSPTWLYGFLCDYGHSYIRPICGLLITAAVGVPLFWWHFAIWNFWPPAILSSFWQAIGLSIANTLGVLGFRKDLIASQIIESLPGSLKVVSAVQTITGIVLLFLLGLAIRNRFRMK